MPDRPTYRPVYKALHRPLTIWGVDRRLFFLSLLLGAATFTGPLARSLALVAIVVGGLMFMFGEGGAKRQISGIVFGGGLALFAGQFLAWLF